MNDRIKSKRVGQVNICEVFGNFCDGFARRGRAAMGQLAQSQKNGTDLLLNISQLTGIDELGFIALRESAARFRKRAILYSPSSPAADQINGSNLKSVYHVLKTRSEAAAYFGEEFAVRGADVCDGDERRGFVRLKTIIPAQFVVPGAEGKKMAYFAVVTNLSEGGLYAEFIDSESEVNAVKNLDPLELKLIQVQLALTPGVHVLGEAKVVHAKEGEGGVGMEFYRIPDPDRNKLINWLTEQYAEKVSDPKDSSGDVQESQGGFSNEKV